MCNFGDQQWTCSVVNVASEANEETTSRIHGFGIRGRRTGLEEGSQQDEETADCCAVSSAKVVCDLWSEQQLDEAAKVRHSAVDTK